MFSHCLILNYMFLIKINQITTNGRHEFFELGIRITLGVFFFKRPHDAAGDFICRRPHNACGWFTSLAASPDHYSLMWNHHAWVLVIGSSFQGWCPSLSLSNSLKFWRLVPSLSSSISARFQFEIEMEFLPPRFKIFPGSQVNLHCLHGCHASMCSR